jgi:lipoprotein Spr
MLKFLSTISLVLLFTFSAFSSDQTTCTIEALSYEHEIKYEDIIQFLNQENIKMDEIQNPDVYVLAYTWLNTPYRYGGNSKNGIDCSRFVMKIYNEALGLTPNGTSKELYTKGNNVNKSDLNEGDLVFFKTRGGGISHVGIYLQDNKFVHSSTSKGVTVSSLDEPYWQKAYYKSARFFEPNPF